LRKIRHLFQRLRLKQRLLLLREEQQQQEEVVVVAVQLQVRSLPLYRLVLHR
jgi:hypothetical protein